MADAYVHGYHRRENERLQEQAGALVELLHSDTAYPSGSTVLEVGCGVGAQTVTLAQRSPAARFTSIDISASSLAEARQRTDAAGITNVELRQADIFALPFDHRHRGRPWVGILPSPESRGRRRHQGPRRAAPYCWRPRFDRPPPLSAASRGRVRRGPRVSADGLRGFEPPRPGRWVH